MLETQIKGFMDFCDEMTIAEEGFVSDLAQTVKGKLLSINIGKIIVYLCDAFIGWLTAVLAKIKGVSPSKSMSQELARLSQDIARSIKPAIDKDLEVKALSETMQETSRLVQNRVDNMKRTMMETDRVDEVLTTQETAKFETAMRLFLDHFKNFRRNVVSVLKVSEALSSVDSEEVRANRPIILNCFTSIINNFKSMMEASYVDGDRIFKNIPLDFNVDQAAVSI